MRVFTVLAIFALLSCSAFAQAEVEQVNIGQIGKGIGQVLGGIAKGFLGKEEEVELINLGQIGKGAGQVLGGIVKGFLGKEEVEAFAQTTDADMSAEVEQGIIGAIGGVVKGVVTIIGGIKGKELEAFAQTDVELVNLGQIGKGIGQVLGGIAKGFLGKEEELEAFIQKAGAIKNDEVEQGILGALGGVIKGVGTIIGGIKGKELEAFDQTDVELVNIGQIGKGIGQVLGGIAKGFLGKEEMEAFTQNVETVNLGEIGRGVGQVLGGIAKGFLGKELEAQTEPEFLA